MSVAVDSIDGHRQACVAEWGRVNACVADSLWLTRQAGNGDKQVALVDCPSVGVVMFSRQDHLWTR